MIQDSLEVPELTLDFSALSRLPTDKDLPSDDGEPLETAWHRPAMNLLIESIECHWYGRKDFYVGGNMFMYFSEEKVFHKEFRGPDFFVVKEVEHDKPRRSWISWKEGGQLPNVIIELSSESTIRTDRVEKKRVYGKKMRVSEYFMFDPRDASLIGWRLNNGGYDSPLEVEPGNRIWSKELELYISPWQGEFLGHDDLWLRFFDVHGKLIPTFGEAESAKGAAEKAKADVAEAKTKAAEAKAQAAEIELERLKQEIAALRNPPTTP